MKLAENIVRINGRRNGKRAHVDIEVSTVPNTVKDTHGNQWGKGDVIPIYRTEEMEQEAFRRGLDAVTSINAYNHVGDCRITERLW